MNTELLDRIEELAGPQRRKTFRKAAEWILEHQPKTIIETGCYRGNPADGQSTLILALLAKETKVSTVTSFEINLDNIHKARELLFTSGLTPGIPVYLVEGDSVENIADFGFGLIGFAYLDSYDHEPHNPGPSQRHELAEIGAIYGRLSKTCAILLDDNIPETGGKTLLGAKFLEERGWKKVIEGYQILFTR